MAEAQAASNYIPQTAARILLNGSAPSLNSPHNRHGLFASCVCVSLAYTGHRCDQKTTILSSWPDGGVQMNRCWGECVYYVNFVINPSSRAAICQRTQAHTHTHTCTLTAYRPHPHSAVLIKIYLSKIHICKSRVTCQARPASSSW